VGWPQTASREPGQPSDPPAGERPAEHPLDRALVRAYRHLGQREHSVAELRRRLERAHTEPEVLEEALAILAEQGYIDDARYTRMLVEDRRSIDGWGEQRIRARLQQAGIDRDLIDQVLAEGGQAGELASAIALLERRWRRAPADDRERQRAFGQLIRMGYESEIAYEAIRAHERNTRST
jgi:regulatory protein